MRKQEELKPHWKSNHLLSRLRNPFKQWNFTIFKTGLIIPQKKKHLRGLGVPCTHGIHMAPWLYKTVINIRHETTPPSVIILNRWGLRLGSQASKNTPVDRSGLHASLSSYSLSVILRVSFWYWDCTNCCAVPSSWAGTLKPLVVWSNQGTVT